jgi:hypothetical protein
MGRTRNRFRWELIEITAEKRKQKKYLSNNKNITKSNGVKSRERYFIERQQQWRWNAPQQWWLNNHLLFIQLLWSFGGVRGTRNELGDWDLEMMGEEGEGGKFVGKFEAILESVLMSGDLNIMIWCFVDC